MQIGKGVCVVFWLLVAAAIAGMFPPMLNQLLVIGGIMILLGHITECGLYLLRLRRPGDNLFLALLQTLAFGMFYLAPRLRDDSAN